MRMRADWANAGVGADTDDGAHAWDMCACVQVCMEGVRGNEREARITHTCDSL